MKRFAKEKLKRWVRVILHTHDSPERTSVAFALGVLIAFLPPVPWFHTIFALVLAFLFRLNRLAVLAGTYTNTPFTIIPLVILETSVGLTMIGSSQSLPEVTFRQLKTGAGWKELWQELTPYLWPLLLGSVVLGLVGAGLAYVVCLNVIRIYRRKVAVAASAAAAAAAAAVAHAAVHAADAAVHAADAAARVAARTRAEAEAEAGSRRSVTARTGDEAPDAAGGVSGAQDGPDRLKGRGLRIDAPETHS